MALEWELWTDISALKETEPQKMPHNTLKLQTKRVAHMKFLPLQLAQDHKANDPTGGRQGQSATATKGWLRHVEGVTVKSNRNININVTVNVNIYA